MHALEKHTLLIMEEDKAQKIPLNAVYLKSVKNNYIYIYYIAVYARIFRTEGDRKGT